MEDKAWEKKVEKAAALYLDSGNVIAVEKAIIGTRKGVALIARRPEEIGEPPPIDGWPVSVLALEGVLTIEDLQTCLEAHEPIEWHSRYEREHWRDKDAPLDLVGIWKIPRERQETWMVMYRCPDEHCLGCRHPTSQAGQFHHKLIRPDGMDSIGRCEEIQVGRKKSEKILVDQPVFARAECTPGATS